MSIESKVAETILQEPESIQIGRRSYIASPPSVATLIHVSKLIAQLPNYQLETATDTDVLSGGLMVAKECDILGEIAATLILGAPRDIFDGRKGYRLLERLKTSRRKKLADDILRQFSAKALNKLIISQLSKLEIGDFFGLTTSLLEVNILRKTKEVVG